MQTEKFPSFCLSPELASRELDVLAIGTGTMEEIIRIPKWPSPGGQENLPIQDIAFTAGGCGVNVACFVGRLGGISAIVIRLGSGQYGEGVWKELIRSKVRVDYVYRISGVEGNLIIILTNQSGDWTVLTSMHEEVILRPADLPGINVFKKAKFLHIDGFVCRSEGEIAAVELAIEQARAGGAIISSDGAVPTAQENPNYLRSLFQRSDIAFANLYEAMATTRTSSKADTINALMKLGPRLCVLKLGAEGSLYITRDHVSHVPAFEIEVVDTVAAGDALIGTLLYSLCRGIPLEKAALLASAAGALACLGPGSLSSYFELPDIENLISRGSKLPGK